MPNIIMKCQADKSWLTEQKQSDETSYTLFQIALVFCSALIMTFIIIACLPKVEQPDYLISSDMKSYMETIAHAEILTDEDMQ